MKKRIGMQIGFLVVSTFISCAGIAQQTQPWTNEYRAVQMQPQSVEARLALAEKYLDSFEFELALAEFRKVLELSPDHERAKTAVKRFEKQALDIANQLNRIELLLKNNALKAASRTMSQLIRQGSIPDELQGKTFLLQGIIQQRQGNLNQARESWLQTVYFCAGTPAASTAASLIARDLINRKQCDEALQWIHQQNDWWNASQFGDSYTLMGHLLDQCYGRAPKIDELSQFAQTWPNSPLQNEANMLLQDALSGIPQRQAERVHILLHVLESGINTPEAQNALQVLEQICQDSSNREGHRALASNLDRIVALSPESTAKLRLNVCKSLLRSFVKSEYTNPEDYVSQYDVQLENLTRIVNHDMPIYMEVMRESLWARLLLVERLFLEDHEILALKQADALLAQADRFYRETGDLDSLKTQLELARICAGQGHPEKALRIAFRVYGVSPAGPLAESALYRAARLAYREMGDLDRALSLYSTYVHGFPNSRVQQNLSDLERLRRLGFADVRRFQRETGLVADGKIGPKTRGKIREMESRLELLLPEETGQCASQGRDVRSDLLGIARAYKRKSQFREAVRAYRNYASLFPEDGRTAGALLEAGKILMESGLYGEALSIFDEISEEHSQGSSVIDAGLNAAACLENLGMWDTAVERYQSLIKRFPRNTSVREAIMRMEAAAKIIRFEGFMEDSDSPDRKAKAHLEIARILRNNLKNPAAAHEQCMRAFNLQPGGVHGQKALIEAAMIAMQIDFSLARENLDTLLSSYKNNEMGDDALFLKGQSYEQEAEQILATRRDVFMAAQKKAEERALLRKDREIRTRYANAITGLAQIQQKPIQPLPLTRRWDPNTNPKDQAEELYRKAIAEYRKAHEQYRLGNKAGDALLRIAAISGEKLRDPQASIKAYEILLKHYPDSGAAVDALFNVGSYYQQRKQYEKARKAFESFVYYHSGDKRADEAFFAIGESLEAQERYQEALEYYKNYPKKYPGGKMQHLAQERTIWLQTYRLQ